MDTELSWIIFGGPRCSSATPTHATSARQHVTRQDPVVGFEPTVTRSPHRLSMPPIRRHWQPSTKQASGAAPRRTPQQFGRLVCQQATRHGHLVVQPKVGDHVVERAAGARRGETPRRQGAPVAPRVVVAIDALESEDERVRRAGAELLERP